MNIQDIAQYLHEGTNWLWVEESLKIDAELIKQEAARNGFEILVAVKHLAKPGEYIINQHHHLP